jgi:hypothetical protein
MSGSFAAPAAEHSRPDDSAVQMMPKLFKTPLRKALMLGEFLNNTQGADDMNDHDKWISYSHWGMFKIGTK